jgi:transposase
MSKKQVYLTIDAHARHCVLGVMNSRGAFLYSCRFATCEKELIKNVKEIGAQKKIMAIEEGPLAFWIAQTLRPYVDEIVISDPRETPLISRNAMKRDKLDVRNLCRLLRLGELKQVYHPEDDGRAIFKAAVQHYIDIRNQQTAIKQKIKAKYRGWGVADVEGKSVYNAEKKEGYLKKVKAQAVRNQLERLYSLLSTTLEMKVSALKEVIRLSRKYPEIKEFLKVPGVGIIGATIYNAYIQTPDRFTRKQYLWRYCKLAVTDRSSDGKPLAHKRLDRAGNGELKAMSYRAFLSAMNRKDNNEVRQFYNNSLKRTHNHTRARLNTQRKILSVLHGVWRSKEVYRPELFLGSE